MNKSRYPLLSEAQWREIFHLPPEPARPQETDRQEPRREMARLRQENTRLLAENKRLRTPPPLASTPSPLKEFKDDESHLLS